LLNAPDGETIDIEQRTNAAQQVHIVRPIKTPTACTLYRFDLRETAFPETQDMLRHVEFGCHFTDGAECVRRLGRSNGRCTERRRSHSVLAFRRWSLAIDHGFQHMAGAEH